MFLKNEKGSALPLVLIVMVVLSLLGFALLNYSIADTMQVARDENRMKAHYLARSGAHAVAQHLLENPGKVDLILQGDTSSNEVDLGEGIFQVEVSGNPGTTVFIESTGTVNGVSQTVLVTLDSGVMSGVALHGQDIFLQGSCIIDGDISFTQGYQDIGNVTVTGEVKKTNMDFPEVDFPSCIDLHSIPYGDLVHPGGDPVIDEDSCTDKVVLRNKHDVLTIELELDPDEPPKDVILLVNEFDSSGGTIKLEGKGRFLLFVRDSFTLNGNYVSGEVEGGSPHTIVFLAPGADFIQTGTTNFEGIIYAPQSVLQTSGGGQQGANILGSIIAENVTGNGNIRVTYKEFDTRFLPMSVLRMGLWRYGFD